MKERERGSEEKKWRRMCLTQPRGVQGGVPLALPLPTAVARAQALQHAAVAVRLGPGVSDAVRRVGVLVVAAVWTR